MNVVGECSGVGCIPEDQESNYFQFEMRSPRKDETYSERGMR